MAWSVGHNGNTGVRKGDLKVSRRSVNLRSETASPSLLSRDISQCLRQDGQPLAIMGLGKFRRAWRPDGAVCLMSTTATNETMAPVHDQTPVIVKVAVSPLLLVEEEANSAVLFAASGRQCPSPLPVQAATNLANASMLLLANRAGCAGHQRAYRLCLCVR